MSSATCAGVPCPTGRSAAGVLLRAALPVMSGKLTRKLMRVVGTSGRPIFVQASRR